MPADELKGYKGRARARLIAWGVRVWSDVRLVNDAGSVFEGVILPRSETLDDEHVVIKMKNGYNVGIHVDRVANIVDLPQRTGRGRPAGRASNRCQTLPQFCRTPRLTVSLTKPSGTP